MAFTEDYSVFVADFGVAAVIGGQSVTGIFDNGYASAFADISGSAPSLLLPTSDVGSAAVGNSITVSSVSYTIAERQDDGTGMTRLVLES